MRTVLRYTVGYAKILNQNEYDEIGKIILTEPKSQIRKSQIRQNYRQRFTVAGWVLVRFLQLHKQQNLPVSGWGRNLPHPTHGLPDLIYFSMICRCLLVPIGQILQGEDTYARRPLALR
jgi:hypothetical protein